MDRREWIALIGEVCENDERGPLALGRFWVGIAEWPLPTRDPTRTYPDEDIHDVSLEDALHWAGERASRVEIRLAGEDHDPYTAGEVATAGRPIADAPHRQGGANLDGSSSTSSRRAR